MNDSLFVKQSFQYIIEKYRIPWLEIDFKYILDKKQKISFCRGFCFSYEISVCFVDDHEKILYEENGSWNSDPIIGKEFLTAQNFNRKVIAHEISHVTQDIYYWDKQLGKTFLSKPKYKHHNRLWQDMFRDMLINRNQIEKISNFKFSSEEFENSLRIKI